MLLVRPSGWLPCLAMGRILRFRRKPRWRRWTEARGYGVEPARFRRGPKSWGQAFSEMRPFLLLIALGTVVAIHQTAGFYEPPGWLLGETEVIPGPFYPCDEPGRGGYCVIDGDTFRLGQRRIRVVGIDTAEIKARCPAEAEQARASTEALLEWLNRGPFELATRIDEPTDRYGRELGIVTRKAGGVKVERVADWMREHGGARGYDGEFREGWC